MLAEVRQPASVNTDSGPGQFPICSSDTLPIRGDVSASLLDSSTCCSTDVQTQLALCINLTKLCRHTVAALLDVSTRVGESLNSSQFFVLEGRINTLLSPFPGRFLALRQQCSEEDLRVVIEEHHHRLTNMVDGLKFLVEGAITNSKSESLLPESIRLLQRYLACMQEEYELYPWKEMPHFISIMLQRDFNFHNVRYDIRSLDLPAGIDELDHTFLGLSRVQTLRILGEICVFNPKKFTEPDKQPQVDIVVQASSGSFLRLEVFSNSIPYKLGKWNPSQERSAAPTGTTGTGSGLKLIQYLLGKHGYAVSFEAADKRGNVLTIELVDKQLRSSLLPPEVGRAAATTVTEYLANLTSQEIRHLALASELSSDRIVNHFLERLASQDSESRQSAFYALAAILKPTFRDIEAIESALSTYVPDYRPESTP